MATTTTTTAAETPIYKLPPVLQRASEGAARGLSVGAGIQQLLAAQQIGANTPVTSPRFPPLPETSRESRAFAGQEQLLNALLNPVNTQIRGVGRKLGMAGRAEILRQLQAKGFGARPRPVTPESIIAQAGPENQLNNAILAAAARRGQPTGGGGGLNLGALAGSAAAGASLPVILDLLGLSKGGPGLFDSPIGRFLKGLGLGGSGDTADAAADYLTPEQYRSDQLGEIMEGDWRPSGPPPAGPLGGGYVVPMADTIYDWIRPPEPLDGRGTPSQIRGVDLPQPILGAYPQFDPRTGATSDEQYWAPPIAPETRDWDDWDDEDFF